MVWKRRCKIRGYQRARGNCRKREDKRNGAEYVVLDLHEYLGGPIFITQGTPYPISGCVAPVALGQRVFRRDNRSGRGSCRLEIGDRVAVEPIVACGTRAACLEGKYNLCSSSASSTWIMVEAEEDLQNTRYSPAKFVHKIPEGPFI